MSLKDKHDPVPLQSFFWPIDIIIGGQLMDFHRRTLRFMENSGALSEMDGKTFIDLDKYDNAVFKYLEQLKADAESATTIEDIKSYVVPAEDLLAERLAFLGNLSSDACFPMNGRVYDDEVSAHFEAQKDLYPRSISQFRKLYEHFIHAHELIINFAATQINTSKNENPTEKPNSADTGSAPHDSSGKDTPSKPGPIDREIPGLGNQGS
jgi:hypothetical protein